MYDRTTNYYSYNNLLQVWNSADPSWYPGNDIVDIFSAECYGTAGDHSSRSNIYKGLRTLSGDTKVIALGEVGNIPDSVKTWHDGSNWVYWMVWNGDFIKSNSYNPLRYKYDIFSSQYILTRDEISGWKGWALVA